MPIMTKPSELSPKKISSENNPFKNIAHIFKNGDVFTRISFLIMGFGNIIHKQVIKGISFLAIEAAFIFYMVIYGAQSLQGLITLGTKTQRWVYNPDTELNELKGGDNSMLLMIYGLATLMLCILFVCVWFVNLRSAYHVQKSSQNGGKVPLIAEEIQELLDKKFYITLLIIPVLGVLLFTILPLVYMILLAFTNFDHAHQPPGNLFHWVGFVNFGNVFNGRISASFFPILTWTLVWAVCATFTTFILGIILALMINKKGIKFKKMWRTIFVLTIAIPQFISLLIMRNMLDAYGPINSLLQQIHLISDPIPFLTNPLWAKVTIIVVNLWIGIPYTMLTTTGILMNLPEDQLEAARIDGANTFQVFQKITLPQIIFIMTPYLIQQFVGNINNFNVIYLLTGGGPSNSNFYNAGSTDLLVTWLYKLTVERNDYNLAATIGICIFILSAVFSLIAYTRSAAFKKEDSYQ